MEKNLTKTTQIFTTLSTKVQLLVTNIYKKKIADLLLWINYYFMFVTIGPQYVETLYLLIASYILKFYFSFKLNIAILA